MERKINLRLTAAALAFLLMFPAAAAIPTPASVRTFYDGIERLAACTNDNDTAVLEQRLSDCFYATRTSSSGNNLPNDFRHFDYDKQQTSHNFDYLNSTTCINRLSEYCYKERKMKVQTTIRESNNVGSQPDFDKGFTSAAALIATRVEKKYTIGGKTKTFIDTVYTDYATGLICEVFNGFGDSKEDVGALKTKAAVAYYRKQYYTAYRYYQKILELLPKDDDSTRRERAETYYRLALMTYYRQGCHYSRRQAHKLGKEYMEKAYAYHKARNVLFHWEYSNL